MRIWTNSRYQMSVKSFLRLLDLFSYTVQSYIFLMLHVFHLITFHILLIRLVLIICPKWWEMSKWTLFLIRTFFPTVNFSPRIHHEQIYIKMVTIILKQIVANVYYKLHASFTNSFEYFLFLLQVGNFKVQIQISFIKDLIKINWFWYIINYTYKTQNYVDNCRISITGGGGG